jgi:hypothetical protein
MKVRIREPKLAIIKRNGRRCPCCDHLNWKCKLIDKQVFKEALASIDEPMFIWDEVEEDWI